MNYHFLKLPKSLLKTFCVAMLCVGFSNCTDDYDLDDKGNYPSWLGNSIYAELSNPNQSILTGTFKNYVRLIDDLGYAETMSKTGSKTVFPANDEAFNRFYANNSWGVSSYEDLTTAQKKLLLYSSMLDNAILVEMLSNVSYDATSVSSGIALKHATNANVIDSITHIYGVAGMPKNNKFWEPYYSKGIDLVSDGTTPMMVHFTQEQMTSNDITTDGSKSDFAIITGSEYNDSANSAYIFRNPIINADVTCKNGYIHQLQDVLVPPGNLAEVIANNGETNLFSRMLDRFSAPFFDGTTTTLYNDYATANGLTLIDSIYQKRYFSSRSQGSSSSVSSPLGTAPNKEPFTSMLKFDPGWNTYASPSVTNSLADISAMMVPTDKAMEEYFLPGGNGEFLIEQFGSKPNTRANLEENIDSLPINIVQAFINNLMQTSFINSVPSKFGNVMDDASDPMGLSVDCIDQNSDGSYNVKIANNGVAYLLNTVFAPNRYVAVSAPALLNDNMKIMNTLINDGSASYSPLSLELNYYAYLLAMSANYGFFIPTDQAFSFYYVDPAYLKHDKPRVLHFYYTNSDEGNVGPYFVKCSEWRYNPTTGEIGDSVKMVTYSTQAEKLALRSIFSDILNYNTVILGNGERMGSNQYYKTKHGGEIFFDGSKVGSGQQLDNGVPMSNITRVYNQKNGTSYAIDHLIAPPLTSVYDLLNSDQYKDRFSEFMKLCEADTMIDYMRFASDKFNTKSSVTKKYGYEAYIPFVQNFGLSKGVNYFSSYNYTVYAPNNEAMQAAYDLGLPTWKEVGAIYKRWIGRETEEGYQAARDSMLAMIEEINAFVRYHFQDNSVYVDNHVSSGSYATACADSLGVRQKLTVTGGNGKFTITDASGHTVDITKGGSKLYNKMTRDYVFNTLAKSASYMSTSSFAVVHEIGTPLSRRRGTRRYDVLWNTSNSKKKLAAHRKAFETKLYKLYR